MARKGLGKGLGALIDMTEDELVASGESVLHVDVNSVDPTKDQPRKAFDPAKLKELSQSIKENGIIQPLIVKERGGRYQIIAGERRYRAARLAKLATVPVIVKEADEKEILQLSIIENIQREDLNPMEEAEAVAALMDNYKLNQEQVATMLGRSRSAVTNTLRLTGLCPFVKKEVVKGTISAGHARALLALKDATAQQDAANYILDRALSVRQTEEYVRLLLLPKTQKSTKSKRRNSDFVTAEKSLSERFDTKVKLQGSEKKGKLTFEYYSKDQLLALFDQLMG